MLITIFNKKFLAKKKYRSEGGEYFPVVYLSVIIELLYIVDKGVNNLLKM